MAFYEKSTKWVLGQIKSCDMIQIKNMKMSCVLKTLLSVALVFGIANPAFAATCNVTKGDSMFKIAKRYKIPFRHILDLNRHYRNPNMIHPNDKINLPHGSEGEATTNGSAGDNIKDGTTVPQGTQTSSQAQQVLTLVNQERAKQGLPALTLSQQLTDIANEKAKDMLQKNYFSHTSPTYGSPFEMLQRFGVNYSSAGENIAAGQKSAEQVMTDWMNSSGHRANILNKDYKQLGVGYAEGGSYGTYWVQLFIK